MFEGAGEVEANLITPAPQPLAEMAEAGNIQVRAGFGIDNEAKGFHGIVLTFYIKEVYVNFLPLYLLSVPGMKKHKFGKNQ